VAKRVQQPDKIVITEVRNFPELGEFYTREFAEPGKQLVGRMLERGIARGEFRAVDVPSTVMSLILPMVMLCLHKHSLGACAPLEPAVDPMAFIQHHADLVLRGLQVTPPAPATAARPRKTTR
jgi:Tetracyclin repressor-like, C-terminal domain